MSVTKRINGDYTIINRDPTLGTQSNVTISTNNFYVDGNLIVGGNSTQVTRTNAVIENNYIVLNQGDPGPGVTLGTSGIEINRGNTPGYANVAIRWNEVAAQWQLTNDGVTFTQISSGAGTALANVVSDPIPTLGGNLNLSNHTIYNAPAGNVSISISTPAAGGTGLYITTTSLGTHELILKRLSLIYNNLL